MLSVNAQRIWGVKQRRRANPGRVLHPFNNPKQDHADLHRTDSPFLPNTQISREAKTWRVANSHKATLLCWLVRDLRFPWRCYIKLSSFYFSFFIWAPSKDQQNHKIPPLGNDRSVYQQQRQQQQHTQGYLCGPRRIWIRAVSLLGHTDIYHRCEWELSVTRYLRPCAHGQIGRIRLLQSYPFFLATFCIMSSSAVAATNNNNNNISNAKLPLGCPDY